MYFAACEPGVAVLCEGIWEHGVVFDLALFEQLPDLRVFALPTELHGYSTVPDLLDPSRSVSWLPDENYSLPRGKCYSQTDHRALHLVQNEEILRDPTLEYAGQRQRQDIIISQPRLT